MGMVDSHFVDQGCGGYPPQNQVCMHDCHDTTVIDVGLLHWGGWWVLLQVPGCFPLHLLLLGHISSYSSHVLPKKILSYHLLVPEKREIQRVPNNNCSSGKIDNCQHPVDSTHVNGD